MGTPEPSISASLRFDVAVQYGGAQSAGVANLNYDWYLSTTDPRYAPERDACMEWWCPACDVIIEAFLRQHGMLALAFEREIRESIVAELTSAGAFPGYWSYFLASRVQSQPQLRALYVKDYEARGETEWDCEHCGTKSRLQYVRGSLVARTGGVLPLCDRCWHWLEVFTPLKGLKTVPPLFGERMKELSTVRTCPVCEKPSAWITRAGQTSLETMLLPSRHTEICSNCTSRAAFGSNRSKVNDADFKAFGKLAFLVGGIPGETDPLFDRVETLEMAVEVAKTLRKLPSRTIMKQQAGSWLKVLIASGILPDGTRRTHFGTMVVARDGHDCLSLAEKEIDDLLSEHSIAHDREPKYPGTEYKADWSFVANGKIVFVEYFGLASRSEYAKRMAAKLAVAAAAGIEVVQFMPEDLKDLRGAFKERILARFCAP